MLITSQYLERVQNIFWKGYERSLHYEHKKEEFFQSLQKLQDSINKKVSGSELGHNIQQVLGSLENTKWASDHDSFYENINQFLKKGFRKKITRKEADVLYLLHTRGFIKHPQHELSKFMDLLKQETAFISRAQSFMDGFHEKLNANALQTEKLRSVNRLLEAMISYSYRLEDLALSQANNLRAANLQALFSVRQEEMKLKKEIQQNLSSMLDHNEDFKSRFQPGRLRRALRLGIVVICLTLSVASSALASELTRKHLPSQSNVPVALENAAKSASINVKITWDTGIHLKEGFSKKQIEETIIEAAGFAAYKHHSTPLTPRNVQINIGFGERGDIGNALAAYHYKDNIVYVNPRLISEYMTDDEYVFKAYSVLVHEVVRFLDFNSYKLIRRYYMLFDNWHNGGTIIDDPELVDMVLNKVVSFDDFTEQNAMTIQLYYFEIIRQHGWKTLERLSRNDARCKALILSFIDGVQKNLQKVKNHTYHQKRGYAQAILKRFKAQQAGTKN